MSKPVKRAESNADTLYLIRSDIHYLVALVHGLDPILSKRQRIILKKLNHISQRLNHIHGKQMGCEGYFPRINVKSNSFEVCKQNTKACERLVVELHKATAKDARRVALEKLTPYERRLLGIQDERNV